MKKITLSILAVAMLTMSSCKKEQNNDAANDASTETTTEVAAEGGEEVSTDTVDGETATEVEDVVAQAQEAIEGVPSFDSAEVQAIANDMFTSVKDAVATGDKGKIQEALGAALAKGNEAKEMLAGEDIAKFKDLATSIKGLAGGQVLDQAKDMAKDAVKDKAGKLLGN